MSRDKNDRFKFAALQSKPGIELQKKLNLDPDDIKSFILIDGRKFYRKTTAALKVGWHLGFPYNVFYPMILIPPFIRNITYNVIAKYRYKWFGKKDACRIPTAEEQAKFLQ